MTAYIPQPGNLLGMIVTWAIAVVLLLAGAAINGRRVAAEWQIMSGWGALCLLLTLWGVFVPLSLRLPAAAFGLMAAAAAAFTSRRPSAGALRAVARVLLLSLPLWVVLSPIRPSQPDTFLNLLPNAVYLVEYGRLPMAGGPQSHSFLPGAPYNTQFLSFLGSLVKADYPPSGMSLVNLMLQLTAGLAIARALGARSLAAEDPPSWGMTAAGLLFATLFNPGFVPRIDLSAYGEPALAAAGLFAALGFVDVQGGLVAGKPERLVPLALSLVAIINTKQSGIGLVAALAGAAMVGAWCERAVPRARALRIITVALWPAILAYLVWRYYVAYAGVTELKLLPISEWNWRAMPAAAVSALKVVSDKGFYFGCVGAAFVALPALYRRQGWTRTTRLLAFFAALFFLYNGFVMLTYLAHFSGEMAIEAHSFFRYNTQLALILTLALAMAARDLGLGAWLSRGRARPAAAAMMLLILLAPFGFIKRLRFDLVMPQPLVWRLANDLSRHLHDGDRLALLLPGDNGSVAAMLAGVLYDATPHRESLRLLRRDTASTAVLDEVARAGYPLAFISCTPPGMAGLPPGEAALLRHDAAGWHAIAAWPYPSKARTARWQDILQWRPLCRSS